VLKKCVLWREKIFFYGLHAFLISSDKKKLFKLKTFAMKRMRYSTGYPKFVFEKVTSQKSAMISTYKISKSQRF